jgi:hypothetical protein
MEQLLRRASVVTLSTVEMAGWEIVISVTSAAVGVDALLAEKVSRRYPRAFPAAFSSHVAFWPSVVLTTKE